MLEVHPPHHAVQGWRDFAVHLLTITVGLLIALGLEAVVEAAHHREVAAQARENIEHELDSNASVAGKNLGNLQKTLESVEANLVAARQHRDGSADSFHPKLDASWTSFGDAAWLTARESGALAHMPLDDVQNYAGLYARQQHIEREAAVLINDAATALAPLLIEDSTAHSTPEDVRIMMLRSADMKMRLTAFSQQVADLGRLYAEVREANATPAATASAPAAKPAPASH